MTRPFVAAVVEQFWHRLPGGTATATERTLHALVERDEFDILGLAARHGEHQRVSAHRDGRLPADVALRCSALPRPALYESWIRFGLPSVDGLIGAEGTDAVLWASSLVVPPTRLPVVSTVHDLDFLENPQRSSRRGRRFFPRMWQVAKQRSDYFVCPSQVVADSIVERGVDVELVGVVPWGVEPPMCSAPDADRIRSELGLPERFVLWVGPITPRKNPAGAAAAMRSVDCDLVLVGPPGGQEAAASVFDALGGRVHRLPFVTNHSLSALYRTATALLYPSLAEGFGLPVLEAMAHGTPVVTSAGTATEEVAAGAALLVDPHDHDALAEALSAAVRDSPVRTKLVRDGLDRAAQLPWSNTAKGYAEIFRAATKRPVAT